MLSKLKVYASVSSMKNGLLHRTKGLDKRSYILFILHEKYWPEIFLRYGKCRQTWKICGGNIPWIL